MERTLPVTLDADLGRTPGWQVARRVEFAVSQIAQTYRGRPADEVAQVLAERLRGLGVIASTRQVQRYAQAIANLAG
jgi:hypothetical protein